MPHTPRPPPRLPPDPTSAQATAWVRKITRHIGPGFHPDETFHSYVDIHTGKPSLPPELCDHLDADLARARTILEAAGIDICAVALSVAKRMLRRWRR